MGKQALNDFGSVVRVIQHGENMSIEEEIDGIKTVSQMEAEESAAEEVKPEAEEQKPAEETKPEEVTGMDRAEEGVADQTVATEPPKAEDTNKDDGFGKPGHTPAGVQSRINELTRRNSEQKSLLEQRDSEIAELKRQLSQMKEPTKADFANEEEYINFVAERKARESFARMEQERAAKAQFDEEYRGYQQSEEFARKVLPDFDEVMQNAQELPGSKRLSAIIRKDSVFGAQVVYTLQKFPQKRAEYLAATTEDAKEAVIRKIQSELQGVLDNARVQQTQPQQTQPQTNAQQAPTQAAAPTATQQLREPGEVNRAGATTKKKLNPSECSMEEWMTNGY